MGFIEKFRSSVLHTIRSYQHVEDSLRSIDEAQASKRIDAPTVVVGASHVKDEQQIQSFNNSNITFNGALAGYDYSKILRDKQNNIVSLYQ
jgi:hypothetical protein